MFIILIGLYMYLTGLMCRCFHDDYKKYPNLFVGYKSKYAMKDKNTWEEAHNYFYKPCKFNFIFSVIFILITKVFSLKIPDIIYSLVIIMLVCGPIVSTEIHLRRFHRHMDKNNN